MRERPLTDVPRWALVLLVLAFLAQASSPWWRRSPQAEAKALLAPPNATSLRLAALGEPIALSRLLMLYVQSFDTQPGLEQSFRQLDYGRVSDWLGAVLALDPRSNYPLLVATHVYGGVNYPDKRRAMYEFVYQQFLLDPNRRWRALADAAVGARHSLKDMALARRYAQALREHATAPEVPIWAKQIEIFIMADMGEVKAARALLGAMFDSGQITDPREQAFVIRRLKQYEAQLGAQ